MPGPSAASTTEVAPYLLAMSTSHSCLPQLQILAVLLNLSPGTAFWWAWKPALDRFNPHCLLLMYSWQQCGVRAKEGLLPVPHGWQRQPPDLTGKHLSPSPGTWASLGGVSKNAYAYVPALSGAHLQPQLKDLIWLGEFVHVFCYLGGQSLSRGLLVFPSIQF